MFATLVLVPAPDATVRGGSVPGRTSAGPGISIFHLSGALLTGVGLLSVLWSMFLPWLASGPATRNSFQLMGLADRYRLFNAWWYRLAPDVWPFWGPAVVVVLLLLVLRLRRSAAVLGLLVGVSSVTVGVLVLAYGSGRSVGGVRMVELGPTTMVVGGVLGCLGAVGLFLRSPTRLVPAPRT